MTWLFFRIFFWSFLFQFQTSALPLQGSEPGGTPPCDPISEFMETLESGHDPLICSEWNPEFVYRGYRCCPKKMTRKLASRCAPKRRKASYCDEMTADQKRYIEEASSGKLGDLMLYLQRETIQKKSQAYCQVTDGFLAWGRPVVATPQNRMIIRAPNRCTQFGTDEMVLLLEWLGREITKQYSAEEFSGTKFLVGDISAPKGGCLSGRGGRRGHRSHTSGQDVDLGFLIAKSRVETPFHFHRQFDAKVNWWFLKKIFENPFACIQVVFLDRRHIAALGRTAATDPLWKSYRSFIRHVRGHRNHFHIRIGDRPGQVGCKIDEQLWFEEEEESEFEEEALLYPELNWEPARGSASLKNIKMHP